jgi:hypothetical protein
MVEYGIAERIAARRAELDELEDQLAKQLEEVRAEHDELAVAEHADTVADTQEQEDQIGLLEWGRSRFGRTSAGEPDRIAEELAADEAVKPADTVLFTVPNQLGVAWGVTQLTAVKAIITGSTRWHQPHDDSLGLQLNRTPSTDVLVTESPC